MSMNLKRLLEVRVQETLASSTLLSKEPLEIPEKDTTDVVFQVVPELLEKVKSSREDYVLTIGGDREVNVLISRISTFYLLSLQHFFEDGLQIQFGYHSLFTRLWEMDANLVRLKENFGDSYGIAFHNGIVLANVVPTDNGIVFNCDERVYDLLRENIIGINSYVLRILQYEGRGPPPTIPVRKKENLERLLSRAKVYERILNLEDFTSGYMPLCGYKAAKERSNLGVVVGDRIEAEIKGITKKNKKHPDKPTSKAPCFYVELGKLQYKVVVLRDGAYENLVSQLSMESIPTGTTVRVRVTDATDPNMIKSTLEEVVYRI